MRLFKPYLHAEPFWLPSIGLPILVTGIGYLPTDWITHSTLLMLYLMVVLYCAWQTDWRGVLVSSVLAFLLFNYFHTQPRYSLLMHDVSELTAAFAFMVFALLAGGLANRLQRQVAQLQDQERSLTAQVDLLNKASRERKEAERRADEEGLRNALLSSVSHDLKTPLVTMLGSATSLRELHEDLSEADRLELLDSIIDESQRLERYIQNLLDMTRLGHGELSLNRQWISVEELYHVVIRRLGRAEVTDRIRLISAEPRPSLWVHGALIEQALFNALDNALKASPKGGLIEVRAHCEAGELHLDVCDQGKGLPEAEWEAVFGQFYSFSRGDQYTKGSGLGLTICRGMMRVHGGDARIVPPPEGFGHCLRLSLPLADNPPSENGTDDHDTDD